MTGLTILAVILVVIAVFLAVILIRTALFKPYPEPERWRRRQILMRIKSSVICPI